MEDETPEPAPKRSRLVEMILKHNEPVYTIETEHLGELRFHRITVGDISALMKAETETPETAASFVDLLLTMVGRHAQIQGEDQARPIALDEVRQLSAEERAAIVKGLIDGLELQYEVISTPKDDDEGERSATSRYEVTTPREDQEDDEAYLHRAWTVYRDRYQATAKRTMEAILGPASTLSAVGRMNLLPGLQANIAASERLRDQLNWLKPGNLLGSDIAKMAKAGSFKALDLGIGSNGGRIISQPPELPRIDFTPPPNPAHKTNTLLADMGERIEAMRAVALTTAEMQQTLNDVARKAVTDFAAGAEQSKAAGDRALLVSVVAAVIGGVSLIVAAASTWVTVDLSHRQARDAKAQALTETARRQAETDLRKREVTATERLIALLEKSPPKAGEQVRPAPVKAKQSGQTPPPAAAKPLVGDPPPSPADATAK